MLKLQKNVSQQKTRCLESPSNDFPHLPHASSTFCLSSAVLLRERLLLSWGGCLDVLNGYTFTFHGHSDSGEEPGVEQCTSGD